MITEVIMPQVSGTLKSAVADRKKPVVPIKLPQTEDRNIVPI